MRHVETPSVAANSAQLSAGDLAAQASLDGWHGSGSDDIIALRQSSDSSTVVAADEQSLSSPGKALPLFTTVKPRHPVWLREPENRTSCHRGLFRWAIISEAFKRTGHGDLSAYDFLYWNTASNRSPDACILC